MNFNCIMVIGSRTTKRFLILTLHLSNCSNFLVLSKCSCCIHPLEEPDVVCPDGVALQVQPHLVQGKVVRLGHLLHVGGQRGLGLLDVEQVGPPQVNVQHSDQTTLKELCIFMSTLFTRAQLRGLNIID